MFLAKETIAAIATAKGRGGVGIIRVSGARASEIAQAILGFIPAPRKAVHCPFKDSERHTIDEGIAIFFPGPNSFTGEDVLELHGHGGTVVLDGVLRQTLISGARLARPGEFLERAFLNNKIDLAQAEAVADLIDAGSEQAARCALRSLQGEFSRKISEINEKLIRLRTYIEAAIDFPVEEIDFISESAVQQNLHSLIVEMELLEKSAKQGALLREGMTVVIAGKPNAGKSSLLNSLSGRDTAIVTDIPGTTRDVLREMIHIDGMPIHIVDTAGLRETSDVVETEGVRRARAEIQSADVILWITDVSQKEEETEGLDIDIAYKVPVIFIRNKIDLTGELPGKNENSRHCSISVSIKEKKGLEFLKDRLKGIMNFSGETEGIFIARRRHLDAIHRALNHIKAGNQALKEHKAGELLAEDLRHAQQALNEITGKFTADDLLGKIFSTFCIGK